MTSIRMAALASVVAAMAALPMTAGAQTGPRNQDTYFTFSAPVELPGTTLPAGRYLFQLADSASNRHIVKVMSEDRQKIHTTLLAIPSYSLDRPPDDPQIRFMEGPATAGNAIKIWFYPGNSVGHEFIYPRSQAMRLAQRTGEPVLTTRTETQVSTTVDEANITRVDPNGADTAANMRQQTASANERSQSGRVDAVQSDPQVRAQAQPEPRAPAPARDAEPRTDLPRTASLLPLLALIGIGSLAGSRMLRRRARQ